MCSTSRCAIDENMASSKSDMKYVYHGIEEQESVYLQENLKVKC